MALDFVRSKIKEIMKKMEEDSDNGPVGPVRKIEFNPYRYLQQNFNQTLILLVEITNINRTMIFKYLLHKIEDSINNSCTSNNLMILNLLQLYVFLAIMDNCFSKIDTKEEFIPDDKKMTLIELYIKIDNPVFGNNVKIIKKAYRTMLISVSKRSPTFFDGLTKTLQQSLNSKLSNNDFITNIAPWIDLTNDLQTLGSFLKVLTTSLTLLSPSYYQVICKTITDIVMNVIKLSSDEYKKFCDQNNTIMIAAQVFDMIDEWDMKNVSYKYNAQFCLMLVRPNILLNQVRDFTIPMFKTLYEMKELKSDSDLNMLSVILKGFDTICYIGAQPTLVNFMMKFIDFPANALKQVFAKQRDLDPSLDQELMINFPISLLYCSIEKFNQIYGNLLLNSKNIQYDVKFCSIMPKICKFTAEKPYSFRNELNALVPLTYKVLSSIIKDTNAPKEAIKSMIPGFAENPFFTRLVFLANPDIYSSIMRMMKEGTIKGVDQLNSSMFNLAFVDDVITPSFWQMLTITLDTYVALSRTPKFLSGPEFQRIPQLALCATEYVKAAIKDATMLPPPESWERLLRTLEEFILLSMTRYEPDSKKTVLDIIKNYIQFSELRPANANQFIVSKLKILLDTPLEEMHRKFSEIIRNEKTPPTFENTLPTLLILFYSISLGLSNGKLSLPNVEPAAIPERLRNNAIGIWISTFTLILSITKILTADMKKLIIFFLQNHTGLGVVAGRVISSSIPAALVPDYCSFFTEILKPKINDTPIENIDNPTQEMAMNITRAMNLLMAREDITAEYFKVDTISNLLDYLGQYAQVSCKDDVRLQFAMTSNVIMTDCQKFGVNINPMVRFRISKNMLIWIPIKEGQKINFTYFKQILQSVTIILDGLSFSDTTIPAGDRNQAAANFTHFFTFIKEGINTKVCDVSELLKLLRAIMKENFYIGMNSCIAMGYDEDPTVRTAFLDGLTNFFSADVYQKIVAFNQKETLIDLLMGGDFDLVKLLASKVPTHQSEEFGRQLTAAAAYKGREFEFFQAMVELELTNSTIVYATEEELNRTTLFRGNGTPSKVFSAYIQMVANEWLLGLMTPIIRKVTLLAESGVSFHIDQTRLDPHENINENREQFRQVFSDFVNQFENNIETMPRGLIKAAQILYNSIVNQSQFVAVQAIASFIFLRFICPTLIEPTRAGYTEAIPEQTRTCLVHLSSLLMVAAVRNRVDAKRPHYAYFANTVQAAYKKLRSCYDRIVSLRITEVPHVLAIDPTAVIISLQKLIAPLIPIVDQILQELKEDNPLRESILVFMSKLRETEQMSESLQSQINNNDVHNGQDFNPVLNKILEKTFYKTDFISIKGDEVFYLDMSTFMVQIPLNQIINHILKTLKGYENSRYTIVCDIGNVDLNILPSPKELIKAASQIPDYIVKNISHIYVVRIPPNFAKYFSETVLMNALPPLEMIETIDAFKNEVSQHTLILGYAAYEGLLPHDAIYSCEYNGEKSTVLLTQQAIVVTSKSKYIKGNTRVVIPYRNFKNIKVSDHPNNNKFFILDKDDCVHNFSVATNSSLFDDIQECLKRSKLITTTRNLIYVERPTLRMLLLNVALINLVSDMADFNVRRSALELIEKTINSTEIKSTIDFSKYANSNYVGSVYEIAEEISDDISRNNSQDVHTFFTEFAKTITYLNHNDFCISSTYLVPWMKNCGEAAIENKRTLDSLAQITASIPQADTCQFTQMFWGSITEEKLFKTLLQMTSEFGNSSSISLFITISNNSKRLTSAITKIMEEENGMTIFFQAARTLISLIIAGTFDEECYPDLLHIIHTAIYNKRTEMTTNLLETIYQKYVGKPDFKASDFNDDLAKKEFKQWTTRASKLSHVIYDIADNAKLDKQKLISLFNSDISTESNDNMQFLSSLLLLCLLDNNSEVYKRKAISLVQTGKPQQIMIGFEALSYLNLTDKESIAFIIGGLLNICSSQSEFSINMVIETTNKFIRNFGISKLKTDEYLTNEIIQRISAESNLPFTQGLVHTMIGIDFVFDSENKLIHLLETQGFENDLLKCFTTTNSQEMVDCFKRTQECAFILLWRFCQRPDDKSTIQGLSEIIRMNQDIFSNLNLQIVYDACERASSPDVLKLLIELARSQKSKKPGKKAGNLFTLFLEKSSVQTLNDDAVSHMISTIYKSIS